MKKLLLFLSLTTLLFVGCEKNNSTSQKDVSLSLQTASAFASGTKTHLGGDALSVYWSEGDQISVNGTASKALENVPEGTSTASFALRGVSSPYKILYPASSYLSTISSTSALVKFPTEQNYTVGSFAEGACLMSGYSTSPESEIDASMQYLSGVMCFTLKKDPSIEGSVSLHEASIAAPGQSLSGEFVLDFETFTIEAGNNEPQAVSINFGENGLTVGDEPVEIYVTLPKGHYDSLLVRFADEKRASLECVWKKGESGVDVLPGQIVKFREATFKPSHREIFTVEDWTAFATAVRLGDYSEWIDPRTQSVNLMEDIVCEDNLLRAQGNFSHTFNGNGHSITQTASTVPLFTTLTSTAVVKNLILKGNTSGAGSPTSMGTASLTYLNYGVIENVTNNMTILFESPITTNTLVAGMVSYNAGLMKNCTQNGDITLNYNITTNVTTYVGGLAAAGSDTVDHLTEGTCGSFENCVNNANITITKTGSAKYLLAKFAVGGICSMVHQGTKDHFTKFLSCENHGNISRSDDATGYYAATAFGGIVGRVATFVTSSSSAIECGGSVGFYTEIVDCTNTGSISNGAYLTGGSTSVSTATGARLGYVGGIAGAITGLETEHALVKNCKNTGDIRGGHENALPCATLGGIVGLAGYVDLEGCEVKCKFYEADLPLSITQKIACMGGLMGYVRLDSSATNCKAYGIMDCYFATATNVGLAAASIYKTAPANLSLKNCGFGGEIRFESSTLSITEANYEEYLVSSNGAQGTLAAENVYYWRGL